MGYGYDDNSFLYDLYGSPQYQDGAGMPGNTFSKRAAALKSMISLSGLPLPQLLAGGYQETQAPAVVNDTARLYGNNPMYKEAFAAIDQGADPQTVLANLVSSADQYDFNPDDTKVTDRIYSTLEDYAKGQSAVSEAQAKADAGRSFTLSNGKKYKGDPNVMGFASEYDLMGRPQTKDLLASYAATKAEKPNKNAVTGSGYSMANRPTPQGLSDVQKFQFERAAGRRLDQSKTNMVRSDANASAMRNLMAIRAMLGM